MNEVQQFITTRPGTRKYFGISMLSIDDAADASSEPRRISEDAIFIDEDSGTYAVFDGVGSSGDDVARASSRAAANSLAKLMDESEDEVILNEPRLLLDYASEQIDLTVVDGLPLATGALVKTVYAGRNSCAWKGASIGDVRVYLVAHDDCCTICKQLTTDETDEQGCILNALGVLRDSHNSKPLDSKPLGHIGRTKNSFSGKATFRKNGWMELSLGGGRPLSIVGFTMQTAIWLLILSDGVYTDLSEEEIAEAVVESSTPSEAAKRLTNDAQAIDDRTAIVVKLH